MQKIANSLTQRKSGTSSNKAKKQIPSTKATTKQAPAITVENASGSASNEASVNAFNFFTNQSLTKTTKRHTKIKEKSVIKQDIKQGKKKPISTKPTTAQKQSVNSLKRKPSPKYPSIPLQQQSSLPGEEARESFDLFNTERNVRKSPLQQSQASKKEKSKAKPKQKLKKELPSEEPQTMMIDTTMRPEEKNRQLELVLQPSYSPQRR